METDEQAQQRNEALEEYKRKLLQHKELDARVRSLREDVKKANAEYDKTEDDLKALQSVGQIIGEVLRQLDEERCKYNGLLFSFEDFLLLSLLTERKEAGKGLNPSHKTRFHVLLRLFSHHIVFTNKKFVETECSHRQIEQWAKVCGRLSEPS